LTPPHILRAQTPNKPDSLIETVIGVTVVFLLTCFLFLAMAVGLVWKLGWFLLAGPIGYVASLVSLVGSCLTPRR
jgi:hypothetical protein